jgi:hypothetical protein
MGLIGWIVGALLIGIPLWKLLPRAGLSPAFAFASVIPILGLILLWVIAFKTWPGDDVSRRFE